MERLKRPLDQYRPVVLALDGLLRKKERVVVAIDGNAAAGKTAMADALAGLYDAAVIHMDHFFLPAEMRTQARLAEAGGNVHYERFLEEVLPYLRQSTPFSYHIYDCAQNRFAEAATVAPKRLTIVEGSYSLHPKLAHAYDLKVFLSIPEQEQQNRILQRNGADGLRAFVDRWIPLEDCYFKTYAIADGCDIVL